MQIEKAYLFGRQISAGEAPMRDNVFFEHGVFNPVHVPQGFDFNNNRQVVVVNSNYDDFLKACTIDFENGEYASHYNDGTTFIIKTDNSDDETLLFDPVSGCIVFEYPTHRVAPSWEERSLYQSIVIPAVGFDSNVDYVYVRLKSTSTKMPDGYVIMFTMEKLSSTSVYGDDQYVWGHADGFYNQWGDVYCMAGYTEGKMDYLQIWFSVRLESEWEEGDDPFRVEIDKIWVTYNND